MRDKIRCKYCGSSAISKYGTYKGQQRYWCKICERKFTSEDNIYKMKTPKNVIASALSEWTIDEREPGEIEIGRLVDSRMFWPIASMRFHSNNEHITNANLIVSLQNSAVTINEEHPEKVAAEMVDACRALQDFVNIFRPVETIVNQRFYYHVKDILSRMEAK